MTDEICECLGEEDCECRPFMRTAQRNKAKLQYALLLIALIGASAFIAVASILNSKFWDFFTIIVILIVFSVVFLVAISLPKKLHKINVDTKILYRNLGIFHWKHALIFFFDIIIMSLPMMIFAWGIVHDITLLAINTSPDTTVPFMYIWDIPEWEWTFFRQGWLDAWLCIFGMFFIIVEYVVWFDLRKGHMAEGRTDDVNVAVISEYEQRIKEADGHFWEEKLGIDVSKL